MNRNFIQGLFIAIALCSCKIDRDKKVNRENFQFKVGADANLFFRNVRQIYYDRESPDGKWQAYRLADRPKEGTYLTPVIVINWLKDEAYLLIDASENVANEDFISIIVRNSNTIETDTLILKERGRERMLEFGSRLYEAIQQKDSTEILMSGKYIPLFSDEDTRESFRIVMSDFYRLTGVF